MKPPKILAIKPFYVNIRFFAHNGGRFGILYELSQLCKYENQLRDLEQIIIDKKVKALLQNTSESSIINIEITANSIRTEVLNGSEELENYMLANGLTVLNFSRNERIIQPNIYIFSNKHHRNDKALAEKTKSLIEKDLELWKFNLGKLENLLSVIKSCMVGE